MTTIPAPSSAQTREEWPDADFDLADGQSIHEVDKDEDWDIEMSLGQTGGARAQAVVAGLSARRNSTTAQFNIRPPMHFSDDDEEEEGVSTIKASALACQQPANTTTPPAIDDDLESAFSLPSELTQLSLRPLSLNHRSSKNSLEWGDHTYSSQSSDAYSTLGFADISPSSNSASSASSICLPEETTDDDDDEGELEGLVIPSTLFNSGKDLAKILEKKKKTPLVDEHVKIASPEDDYEDGLEIDDDVDLSPSRLLLNTQQAKATLAAAARSISAPLRPPSLKLPSRKTERAKSPSNPPVSSQTQLQKLRLSPSPPLYPPHPSRAQTFQALTSAPPTAPSNNFLAAKPGSLRGQKSHSVLTGNSPPQSLRKMPRKASLSSLIGTDQPIASTSSHKYARYEEPTAASISRAKANKSATSRAHDYKVPPTRPTTPSTNTAAVRLTMPTVLRHKSRPALSSVFTAMSPTTSQTPVPSSVSPPPSRPSSKASVRSMTRTPSNSLPSNSQPPAPKVLRRPKRQRTYGDGTELDAFDDLPTDRDKESQYRVQPKASGNRVVGGSYPAIKSTEKGTIRRKSGRESLTSNPELPAPLAPMGNTLKRTNRIEFPAKTSLDVPTKKKKPTSPSSPHTCRKPTLIRNLGGANAPKVVGDMKWNPQTLRWEGNDQVLREFDAVVGTSTRPALITHLTGSSIGSPAGSFAAGARRVGNMIFDPARMCWISTLPPEEDEPDVFANMADDEWESKGDTIRVVSRLGVSANNTSSSSGLPEAPSPARSHTRTLSESGSERGSRASLLVCDVDEAFVAECKAAEERHRSEMKGWQTSSARLSNDSYVEPDRSYLYEIRALATRRY